MRSAQIDFRDVSRTYRLGSGDRLVALDSVSFTLAASSVTALTGPSGSGKSTLLHVAGGIDRPDRGYVTVDGTELGALSRKQLAHYRRGIGFVFQRFNLLPALSVLDNVIAPIAPYRVPYDKAERAVELLRSVGIEHKADELPSKLSGGQQQRVAIARALIGRPSVLLADEPTGNLDSRTGSEIIDLLLDLRERHGTTTVIATHDPAVADRCDRVVTLRDGRVVSDDTPNRLRALRTHDGGT